MTSLIEKHFPKLVETGYIATSPPTKKYNCIAFTLGDVGKWWWPPVYGEELQAYWPKDAPCQESLNAFVAMYKLQGFEVCTGTGVEPGVVKIVILVESKEGLPAHAALQLPNGKWISKMWEEEDILHSLEGLMGSPHFFEVGCVMRCALDAVAPVIAELLRTYGGVS